MLGVEVINDKGEDQAATTSLRARNGIVRVDAFDSHYSNSTISLVRKPTS